jgi:hypothetical protein
VKAGSAVRSLDGEAAHARTISTGPGTYPDDDHVDALGPVHDELRLRFSERDGIRRTRVRAAIGSEQGYVLATTRIAVRGLVANDFPVHVFDLGREISAW